MSGSYFTLNAKYNSLLALFNQFFPYPPSPYPAPNNVMTLSTNQTATGLKTFSTLPQSSVVPLANDDFTNKLYVDSQVGSTPDIDAVLGQGDIATGKQMLLNDAVGTNFTLYTPTEIQVSDGVNDTAFFQPTQLQYTDITGTISATWADIISGSASSNTLEEVLTAGNEADLSIVLKDNLVTPTLTNIITSSAVSITGDGVGGSVGFQVGDVNTIGTATGVLTGAVASATGLTLSNFTASTAPFFSPLNTTINLISTTTTASLGFTSGGAFVNAKTMDLTLDGITHTSSSGGNFTINTTDEFNVIADEINATTITGMSVLSSGAGGTANPSLLLANSNATLNADPTIELYKTGRNLVVGELVGSISMYGLDAVAQKTEFARIQTKAENVASGNEDGTLSIFNSVNGAILETFNFNGGQNENNSFRPLDMNGNALRTTTGDLPINATASSGTGHIDITSKTGAVVNVANNININASASTGAGNIDITAKSTGVVNINSNVVMDNSESLMIRNTANTIYNSQTQSSIGLVDITTPLNSKQHILTNTLQQITNQQATTFVNESDADLTSIRENDNSSGADINRLSLTNNAMVILNNTNPTAPEQLDMNATSISFTSSGSAVDSLSIVNDSASGGKITWSNTTGSNGLEITSDRPLTFSTTANAGAGNGDMIFNVSSTIGDLAFNGANIQATTSTGSSGQYLQIRLNGTYYKIPLDNI